MSTGPERSNSIHNFTMPHELRWGNRRFLRCAKVNSDGRISPHRRVAAINTDQHRRINCTLQPPAGKRDRGREIDPWSQFLHGSRKISRTSPPASGISRRFSGYGDGIAATRERVILDLQSAAEAMKDAIFKDKHPPPPAAAAMASAIAAAESELSRPWNLRTRQADLKTSASKFVLSPNVDAGGVNAPKSNPGLSQTKGGLAAAIEKPMRLRSDDDAAAGGGRKERPKFAVALSKREIEEDFYSMAGRRPPRRPKKRNRNVQRELDSLFPGLWLSEVTPNMYKVRDDEGR